MHTHEIQWTSVRGGGGREGGREGARCGEEARVRDAGVIRRTGERGQGSRELGRGLVSALV